MFGMIDDVSSEVPMQKACILGCGKRSREHARAYQFVTGGKIAAACDQDQTRLSAYCNDYGIERRYTDLNKMLEKEKPDVLHLVTPPLLRYDLMCAANDHEVPVVIVEKPIAVQGEDWRQLVGLHDRAKTRFVVNTQVHFWSKSLEFKRDVAEGRIGDILLIDISTRSTIADQGVHVLELAHTFNGCAAPVSVFGQVSGEGYFYSNARGFLQPCPDLATATIKFSNGVRATFLAGASLAPAVPETDFGNIFMHKRIQVFGTRGFVHWTFGTWERFTKEAGLEKGTHIYRDEDVLGQARLTDAAFAWARTRRSSILRDLSYR